MAQFADPYVANIVPSLNRDDARAMIDLERFLNEELDRIAVAIQQTSVQAAYGSILTTETATLQTLDTTADIIIGWDTNSPEAPNRTLPDAATDNITVLESGVFCVILTMALACTADTFVFTIFRNGAAAPVYTIIDPSNQTDAINVVLSGIMSANAGDVFDIRGAVLAGTGDITMLSGAFSLFRVSEAHKPHSVVP